MPGLAAIHSAETRVQEPADLWRAGLPAQFRDKAFRLLSASDAKVADDGYVWAHPDGRPIADLEDTRRQVYAGTTTDSLLAMLDAEGIDGAVLYPSVAAHAYAVFAGSEALGPFLDVYNEWILGVASAAPERLRGLALLDMGDPPATAAAMRRLAERGAAGFVLPSAPGEGLRYDRPRFEVLWRTAAELGRPISLQGATGRGGGAEATEGEEPSAPPTPATVLAFKATSVFPARRSITAITYAGVFGRYPDLRIGIAGFGTTWAAYAMVRADEMYEVRPERTGPPARPRRRTEDAESPAGESAAGESAAGEQEAGAAIPGDVRTGTRGMAAEGVGYQFPPGERFSDHFRRNVFLTFSQDSLGVALRGYIGTDAMLWGQGRRWSPPEQGKRAKDQLHLLLADLPDDERNRLAGGNTARIYGFGAAAHSPRSSS
jgi:predicted TIM-barrel fold metal-dependent hydrolase